MVFLGLILVGISLVLTAYGVSKRLTTDINVYRLTDILEFSYLAIYTGNSYEVNFGDIKSFLVGNDTIKLENICLKAEKTDFLSLLGENLLFSHSLYSKQHNRIKVPRINNLLYDFNKFNVRKKLANFVKSNLLSFFSKRNLLGYLAGEALETGYTVYSKLNFKCVVIGNEFKLGKFYDYDIVLTATGEKGQKIKFSTDVKNKKLVVNLTLKEFLE